MSVPGVGPITALTFTASIEDPRRFERSEDVGAYAGLVPTPYRPVAIMKARTRGSLKPFDDLEVNHWPKGKEKTRE
jgi:transposase